MLKTVQFRSGDENFTFNRSHFSVFAIAKDSVASSFSNFSVVTYITCQILACHYTLVKYELSAVIIKINLHNVFVIALFASLYAFT